MMSGNSLLNLFKRIYLCQCVIYSQNITRFRFWAGLSNWRKLPVIDLQSVFPVWDPQQEASANQKPLSRGAGQWEAGSQTGCWPHFHQILFTTQCFIPPGLAAGRQPTIPPIPQHNNKEHEDSQEHWEATWPELWLRNTNNPWHAIHFQCSMF